MRPSCSSPSWSLCLFATHKGELLPNKYWSMLGSKQTPTMKSYTWRRSSLRSLERRSLKWKQHSTMRHGSMRPKTRMLKARTYKTPTLTTQSSTVIREWASWNSSTARSQIWVTSDTGKGYTWSSWTQPLIGNSVDLIDRHFPIGRRSLLSSLE